MLVDTEGFPRDDDAEVKRIEEVFARTDSKATTLETELFDDFQSEEEVTEVASGLVPNGVGNASDGNSAPWLSKLSGKSGAPPAKLAFQGTSNGVKRAAE